MQREELVRRLAASSTFERSPRLRAFFLHVCRCALDNRPEGATEQQIGICVYDRPLGYNPNDDNIVRSQARQLRLKLEHHFANEGKDEAIVITIPKGRYLPVFEPRFQKPAMHVIPPVEPGRFRRLPKTLVGVWPWCSDSQSSGLASARSSRSPPLHMLLSLPQARSPARNRARRPHHQGANRSHHPP